MIIFTTVDSAGFTEGTEIYFLRELCAFSVTSVVINATKKRNLIS